jgi:hypothetical protein
MDTETRIDAELTRRDSIRESFSELSWVKHNHGGTTLVNGKQIRTGLKMMPVEIDKEHQWLRVACPKDGEEVTIFLRKATITVLEREPETEPFDEELLDQDWSNDEPPEEDEER